MTKLLVSDSNLDGYRLEDIFMAIRADMIARCTKLTADTRPEASHVLDNNVKIMSILGQAIGLAEESTRSLDKAFGPSTSAHGGKPRIGVA